MTDQNYANAWQTITKMLREGRSLSGRERNCCFLNTGGSRFADVSGTTGFDFPDDARGLATVDWDFDGDLDIWLTNRTAPRVRYLRNDGRKSGSFVAFKLQGKSCNRDAIGARVEVAVERHPKAPASLGQTQKLIRTLRAGEGFLSQSSKWLHFGLGSARKVTRVTVRWPGGLREDFGPVEVGGFYRLEQGRSAVARFAVPSRGSALQPRALNASKPPTESIRIVEPGRPQIPDATYIAADGRELSLRAPHNRPMLVMLWASWCAPCVEELKGLAAHASELKAESVDVLAINVEALESSADIQPAERLLKEIDFPFSTGKATPSLATALDVVQKAIVDRSRPLGLPSSFLLDSQRRLVVAYLGPVKVQEVIDDLQLLDANNDQLRDAAAFGRGRWATEPYNARPVHAAIARRFIEAGEVEAAVDYIHQVSLQSGGVFAQLATAFAELKRWEEAVDWQTKAAQRASPNKRNHLLRRLESFESQQAASAN